MASKFEQSLAAVADALNPADSPNTQLSKFHEALCKMDPSDHRAAVAAMGYGQDLRSKDGDETRLWGSSVTGFDPKEWLAVVKIDNTNPGKSTKPIIAYLGCES